jgi:hypothetical protein
MFSVLYKIRNMPRKLKRGDINRALRLAGKLSMAAREVVRTSDLKYLSKRIVKLKDAVDAYDSEIFKISFDDTINERR